MSLRNALSDLQGYYLTKYPKSYAIMAGANSITKEDWYNGPNDEYIVGPFGPRYYKYFGVGGGGGGGGGVPEEGGYGPRGPLADLGDETILYSGAGKSVSRSPTQFLPLGFYPPGLQEFSTPFPLTQREAIEASITHREGFEAARETPFGAVEHRAHHRVSTPSEIERRNAEAIRGVELSPVTPWDLPTIPSRREEVLTPQALDFEGKPRDKGKDKVRERELLPSFDEEFDEASPTWLRNLDEIIRSSRKEKKRRKRASKQIARRSEGRLGVLENQLTPRTLIHEFTAPTPPSVSPGFWGIAFGSPVYKTPKEVKVKKMLAKRRAQRRRTTGSSTPHLATPRRSHYPRNKSSL